MKRNTWIGVAVTAGVIAGLSVMPRAARTLLDENTWAQAPAAASPHAGEGGVPLFELDPKWPTVPAKWKVGDTSSATVDEKDHVWIIHRPRTLPAAQLSMAAPPVMEFDNDGTFIQGWGGAGQGYEWPQNEHGIHVDYNGYVWIVGNEQPQDAQILKFTKTGTFVKQFGRSGQSGGNGTHNLKGASSLRIYPKTNELFVSDGYGNSRVIVFDADSGAFKRMWGAYGHAPLDIGLRPPRTVPDPTDASMVEEHFKGLLSYADDLRQFHTVHDVAISKDGFVYVADRGNKRIQVFTVDGTYVTQQFVGLDNIERLQARSVAFSADPEQTFLYVSGTPQISILNRRTLEILSAIESGDPKRHPAGHHITTDAKGNLYSVQADQSSGVGIQKFVFKGLSPARGRKAR